jgi:hypothetical protein
MSRIIPILKVNTNFTPYKFYTDFLEDVANCYKSDTSDISLKLFEQGDDIIYNIFYRIDPIAIPLLLSLAEQLSKFHKKPLTLNLYNNRATIDVLEFLFRCDFFQIAGQDDNHNFPIGRNILKFDKAYLGAFKGKTIKSDHKVRGYSLADDGLHEILNEFDTDEKKRDFLISHYTYKVNEHFEQLLFENRFTKDLVNIYINILSELITNAVLHSQSNAFALMFVDSFKTKFSISDNGVGFATSMKLKSPVFFYQADSLKIILSEKFSIPNIPKLILDNLFTIFETLYYSSLKDRRGLFDLMLTAVLHSKGYFRIHNENSQVIISNRMMDGLILLEKSRNKIYNLHNLYSLKKITEEIWISEMKTEAEKMKNLFISFCEKAFSKYSNDIKYSSIRFFKVKFRGVHVEVEIPNKFSDDNFNN